MSTKPIVSCEIGAQASLGTNCFLEPQKLPFMDSATIHTWDLRQSEAAVQTGSTVSARGIYKTLN